VINRFRDLRFPRACLQIEDAGFDSCESVQDGADSEIEAAEFGGLAAGVTVERGE
jgi:hypothetical protein